MNSVIFREMSCVMYHRLGVLVKSCGRNNGAHTVLFHAVSDGLVVALQFYRKEMVMLIGLSPYVGYFREVARGVRDGCSDAIRQMAWHLTGMIHGQHRIIPMPSHLGYPTNILRVSQEMEVISDGRLVSCPVLKSKPHHSHYMMKKWGMTPPEAQMFLDDGFTPSVDDIVIDNVIDTGATANAALKVLPMANVLCLCKRHGGWL